MLLEMDVINAVVKYLEKVKGYGIKHAVKSTKEKGVDIEVYLPDGELLKIEAKGQTSSEPHSTRYKKEFSSNQKLDHVSKALYATCTYITHGNVGGIALPGDCKHRELVERIDKTIKTLRIRVFFVDVDTREVDEYS